MASALKSNQAGNIRVQSTDASSPLPPASLQSFLKKDLGIPGLLIANHRNAFTNLYYNSEWDTFESINTGRLSRHLADIARTVAAAVYQLAAGEQMPNSITANLTLVILPSFNNKNRCIHAVLCTQVEKTLECYLINANCSLFNWLLNGRTNMIAEGILPTYVGVSQREDSIQPLSVRTRNLLALVSGEQLPINKSACFDSDNNEVTCTS